jgi:coenzyme F420 hydrogenase subunit beta
MLNSNACHDLDEKVIKKGLCVLCGACVGNCPYLAAYEGKVLLRDTCELNQGQCKDACPRLLLDLDAISRAIFNVPYSEDSIGTVRKVIMAQAADTGVRAGGQDAGAVTALMKFAMEEGFIDSAILTSYEDRSWPRGIVATRSEQITGCSRSSYLAAPTVEGFNQAMKNTGCKSIGFVGTPCQIMALAKMRVAAPSVSKDMGRLKLVIGLFCTWALSYPDFSTYLREKVQGTITKYEIPPHPANAFIAYTETGSISIPLDEVLPYVRPACRYCLDLTAEFADISIGGGRREVSGWNTIIVRSGNGEKLVDAAIKKGVIETTLLPEGNLGRLEAAARNKKNKALEAIIKITGNVDDLLYLKSSEGAIKRLLVEYQKGRK